VGLIGQKALNKVFCQKITSFKKQRRGLGWTTAEKSLGHVEKKSNNLTFFDEIIQSIDFCVVHGKFRGNIII
jgi:hypothetical protein